MMVVERNGGAAEEASHGNASVIAPGHAYAWASPRAPLTLPGLVGNGSCLAYVGF